jgi:hypothetical protein
MTSIICRLGVKSVEQEDDDIYSEIDLLLFELDNVIGDELNQFQTILFINVN